MKIYWAVFLSGLAVCVGCGGSSFPTAAVTGVVLCDGKPVEGAMVYFEPLAGDAENGSPLAGKQGFSYSDASGRFTISTYAPGEGDGAVVGKHRVRVGRGSAKCGCAMNEEVDLMEVEVKADETNEFELVLKKATPRDLARERMNRDDDEE